MAADVPDFARLVPGFDFLQGLAKSAGSALPAIGQWVAPTLDPAEIEKRIDELRTVQFWLEQNVRMLAATIQALEVQRMTLSTLTSMNVQVADLRESLRIKMPDTAGLFGGAAADRAGARGARGEAGTPDTRSPAREAAASDASDRPADADGQDVSSEDAPRPRGASRKTPAAAASGSTAAAAAGNVVDPMQWWTALTRQFGELATQAVRDTSAMQPPGARPAAAVSEPAAARGASSAARSKAPAAAEGAVRPATRGGRAAKPKTPARRR